MVSNGASIQRFSFSDYTSTVVQKVNSSYAAIEPVDAIEFLTSPYYMGEILLPFQSIFFKTLYRLWDIYPATFEEKELLFVLEQKWKITINLNRRDSIEVFLLVLGRRSGKTSLISMLATYSAYRLICLGNPQEHYHMRERHPIHITHIASAGDQAEDAFTLTADNLRKVDFFRPYIDFDKDNSTELQLFTPYDLYLNNQIHARNSSVPRGEMRENLQKGSILIESITTSSKTHRGKAIYTLIFSEFAHFQRARIDKSTNVGQFIEENPKTDYAMFKAMSPSVKDFKEDGTIVLESSPAEKGGEFYRHYCIAGGMEQDTPYDEDSETQERFYRDMLVSEEGYALMQLSTWEASPVMYPRESFNKNFRSDPTGANMEYGSHFGNPSGTFISESLIASLPIPNKSITRTNPGTWRFIIALDPGGKAKKKEADTYALSWGHAEIGPQRSVHDMKYFIDGFEGWDAIKKPLGGGMFETVIVDPNMVVQRISELVQDLGGRNFVTEVCYDQWQCLRGDTLIDTNYGFVDLNYIYKEFNNKDFYIHFKNRKYKIKNIVNNGVRTVYSLVTKFGFKNYATEKHRFKVRKNLLRKKEWVRVRDLKNMVGNVKCEIVCTSLWAENNPDISQFTQLNSLRTKGVIIPKIITPELGRFLGYMIAEGYIEGDRAVCFSNINKELKDDFIKLSKLLFNKDAKEFKDESCVYIVSVDVANFLRYVGYKDGSKLKEIPWSILQSKKEIVVEFLKGYFEGDGWSCINSEDLTVGACSVSNKLMHQIQLMLTKFRIISSLHNCVNLEGTNVTKNLNISWSLYLRGNNIKIFKKEIGFISSTKQEHLDICISRIPGMNQQTKRYFRDDDIYLDRLIGLGEYEECEVFDIEVDDLSCEFSANAFVSHNSQSSVSTLQSMGIHAIETTFTNEYKSAMFESFLTKAELGQVHSYGIDEGGWLYRWQLELKYLQRDIAGKYVFYHHPSSGPVRHDDFVMACANLIHRLVLAGFPTRESIEQNRLDRNGQPALQQRRTVFPVKGPNLFNRGAGGYQNFLKKR
jgi:intein/homing endonuclease